MNILLITGGWSSEREVAIAGAKNIQQALEKLGHSVVWFDLIQSFEALATILSKGKGLSPIDFAFINLHGSPGEDGIIQAMLERFKCPYQGSGPSGSMLALNKYVAKTFFRDAGINTAQAELLLKRPEKDWTPKLDFPLFLKSNTGGSSLNIAYVEKKSDLTASLNKIVFDNHTYIAETAIKGIEVTCGVLGEIQDGIEVPVALPPILIETETSSSFFDYEDKYSSSKTREICPAPLPEKMVHRIQELSVLAHLSLGLRGYSRADFIIPEGKDPVILEVNTLPGMSPASLIPKEVKAIGLSFEDLLNRLIQLGLFAFEKGL